MLKIGLEIGILNSLACLLNPALERKFAMTLPPPYLSIPLAQQGMSLRYSHMERSGVRWVAIYEIEYGIE